MQSTHENVRSWPVSWDRLPAPISQDAARRAIRDAGLRNTRMMQAVRNVRATSLHDARRLQRRYLLSNSAKLAAFVDAWQRAGHRVSNATDEDVVELVKLAVAHHPMGKFDERAFAWPKHKRDGEGYRIIHKLRFRQSAQDKLAARAAQCLADLLPTQFNRTGKGMHKLDAWLAERLPNAKAVITVDIPSCFNNVDRSSVEVSLLLPQRVVEMALFDLMDKAKHKPAVLTGILTTEPNDVATSLAKRGIPQGSALAQVASEIEIDKVLRKVASVDLSVHVAAHGDNLIFLLDDATLFGSVYSALTTSVTKHFGGAATSKLVHRIKAGPPDRFEYCRRIYTWRKGQMKISLRPDHVGDYASRITVAMEDAWSAKSSKKFDSAERSIKTFARDYAKASGAFEECAELWTQLADYRDRLAKFSLQGAG